MTSNELREILFQEPFRPFCVRLVSGEQLEIKRPHRATLFAPTAIFGVNDDPETGHGLQMRIVPVEDIVAVEAA